MNCQLIQSQADSPANANRTAAKDEIQILIFYLYTNTLINMKQKVKVSNTIQTEHNKIEH